MKPSLTHDELSDIRLRELLKRNAISAPPSPWFSRKVLNRLPPRRKAFAAWMEYTVYIIAACLTATVGIDFGLDTLRQGIVTVSDIATLCACLGLFFAICWIAITPWITGHAD